MIRERAGDRFSTRASPGAERVARSPRERAARRSERTGADETCRLRAIPRPFVVVAVVASSASATLGVFGTPKKGPSRADVIQMSDYDSRIPERVPCRGDNLLIWN